MKGYKLVRIMADGSIASLFINKTARLPVGRWIDAGDHPTAGYAHRPGWHFTLTPNAPHLSRRGRIWVRVEADTDIEIHERPDSQGGRWGVSQRLKITDIMYRDIFKEENARFTWEKANDLHLPGAYIATMREIYNSLGPRTAELASRANTTDLVNVTRGFFEDLTDKDHFDDLDDDDIQNYIDLLVAIKKNKNDENNIS